MTDLTIHFDLPLDTNLPAKSGYGPRTSRLDKAIEQCLGSDTQRALDAAMKDAKAQALAAFSQVAEQKLGEALRQSIAAVAR